jgi:dipeptidyl aminopeptidase/acylaminoacyl peptidase
VVYAATTGFGANPRGYSVRVDAGPDQSVALNGEVRFTDLAAGAHTVTLTGQSSACAALAPRGVVVTANATASVELLVRCADRPIGQIVFEQDSVAYLADPDGSHRSEFIPGRGRTDLRWSPDGSRIAFVDLADRNLYAMNRDGSNPVRLTTDGLVSRPAWSPDGSRIAVAQNGSIVVIQADGSGRRILTAGSAPAWSPDGSRIAFVRSRGDHLFRTSDVWLVGEDGTGLTSFETDAFDPAWSPDGSSLVVCGRKLEFAGGFTVRTAVYLIPMAGSPTGKRRIASGGSSPVWSPDGAALALAMSSGISVVTVNPASSTPMAGTGPGSRPMFWR